MRLIAATLLFTACTSSIATRPSDREALLDIHRRDRHAHFQGDVDLLQQHSPEEFIAVSGGKIDRVSKAGERAQFESMFKGSTYEAWDDLEPPIIRISPDGRMAWMIVRLKVRGTQRDDKGQERRRDFVYAGIMTYEKRDGKWMRVANVSTFE